MYIQSVIVVCGVLILTIFVEAARRRQLIDCYTTSDCTIHSHLKHFSCIYGKCNCDEKKGLILDRTLKTCAKLAGQFCNDSDEIPCVSNAYCDKNSSKCECVGPEHSATINGECKLNYGQSCSVTNASRSCNPFKFLRCNLEIETCTCANDDEQIYDAEKGSCVGRPGQRCEFEEYSGIQLSCVQNSSCVNLKVDEYEGICTCDLGLISTDSAKCLPGLGSPCSLDHLCSNGLNLYCNETSRKCQCSNQSVPKVIRGSEQCILKVNSPCTLYEDTCIDNAECTLGGTNSITCQCLPGYKPSQSMMSCKLNFGQFCGNDSECADDLSCLKNSHTCGCKSLAFYWDGSICRVKVGKSCLHLNSTTRLLCGKNAICHDNDHICVCNDKYAEIDGKCYPILGSACTTGRNNNGNGCAKNHHLLCTDGICNCDSETILDLELNICRVKAGQACHSHNVSNDIIDICTRNSICLNNQCTCESGYDIQRKTGLCKPSYKNQCSRNLTKQEEDCDEDKFLKCTNNQTCGCLPNHEVYDNELKECVKLPNEYCETINGNHNQQRCANHAECIIVNTDGTGICICKFGYRINDVSKLCELVKISSFSSRIRFRIQFPLIMNMGLIYLYSVYH